MIHTQNITFNKFPGQNIKVRLTHFLPSGKYQLAMVPYKKNENNVLEPLAKPSCSCRLERLDLGKHALSVILSEIRIFFTKSLMDTISVLLVVVIVTGWMTTMYSNFKEEDIMIGNKEPASVLVVADLDSCAAHTRVMEQMLAYLREFGGVDRVYYARDAEDGQRHPESIRTWWRRALRDVKVVKDGCVIFFPGPPRKQASIKHHIITQERFDGRPYSGWHDRAE